MSSEFSVQQIQAAMERIRPHVPESPLLPVGKHTTSSGNSILLKAENLQPSGSFKIRGATHAITQLDTNQKARGVIAYSTGNHAQAVAMAAQQAGVRATIVMSPDAPSYKLAATKRYGAEIVMADSSSEARRVLAEQLAKQHGYQMVPPYDDEHVLAGQGTIGLEILARVKPAAVYVPIGGGGLITGIATAIKSLEPNVKIIGVEPEWENDAYQSFYTGKKVVLERSSTSVADAIRVQTLGDLTFPLILRYVDEIVTVSEESIINATLRTFREMHVVLEPAGALSLAAALQDQRSFATKEPVVIIGSGGNVSIADLFALEQSQTNVEMDTGVS